MIDNNIIKNAKNSVKQFLREKKIIHEKAGRYTEFFLKNAQNSFNSAKLLYNVSINNNLKNH